MPETCTLDWTLTPGTPTIGPPVDLDPEFRHEFDSCDDPIPNTTTIDPPLDPFQQEVNDNAVITLMNNAGGQTLEMISSQGPFILSPNRTCCRIVYQLPENPANLHPTWKRSVAIGAHPGGALNQSPTIGVCIPDFENDTCNQEFYREAERRRSDIYLRANATLRICYDTDAGELGYYYTIDGEIEFMHWECSNQSSDPPISASCTLDLAATTPNVFDGWFSFSRSGGPFADPTALFAALEGAYTGDSPIGLPFESNYPEGISFNGNYVTADHIGCDGCFSGSELILCSPLVINPVWTLYEFVRYQVDQVDFDVQFPP